MRGLGIKRWLTRVGYDRRNWLRVRQIDSFQGFLSSRGEIGDVLEVSPGWNRMWQRLPAASYTAVDYPEFDICRDVLARRFDIVIADQVLEHVPHPVKAVQHLREMLEPGGHAMIATPFLFRVHARPHDYHRWTEAGLRQLLLDGGFDEQEVTVQSWGNRACVRAHAGGPVRDYGFWRDMRNEPEYPVMVWAFAQRR
jgi:SAM-dependent methyltransferase